MKENQRLASEAQKKANDAVFKSLSIQQDSLASDAQKLVQIQASAQNADGQLAAIGYANQLASAQTNQLMQIRALLISQQNMIATQSATQADKDARNQASEESRNCLRNSREILLPASQCRGSHKTGGSRKSDDAWNALRPLSPIS